MAIRMHETHPGRQAPAVRSISSEAAAIADDWRWELPTLTGESVVLRQIRPSDAASLLMLLGSEDVVRYITPAPATVSAFEEMIRAALDRQRQGRSAFFAVLPRGVDAAVGIVQIRSLERGFRTAEWGIAIGRPYWGRGLFTGAAAYRALDVLGRHIVRLRFGNDRAEARVTIGVAATCASRDRELFDDAGENLSPLRVGGTFLVLDGMPLGMARHVKLLGRSCGFYRTRRRCRTNFSRQ